MTTATKRDRRGWTQNPEAVKRDILSAAITEFAAKGLHGARVAEIAERTRTSKRMIYYYFGDKLGLYIRALEAAYMKVREGEKALDLDHLPPREALAQLVAFTFDHHKNNPDFIRMVMIENIHNAENVAASDAIREVNTAAIDRLATICRRGKADGVFRDGIDPVTLHWQISAASFFNVSNQPTFSAIFGNETFSDETQAEIKRQTVEAILAITLA
jgi:AcrR family transcriptional regulator